MSNNELLLALSEMMDTKLKSVLQEELKKEIQPIKADIAELKKEIQPMKADIAELKKEIQPMKADIAELKKEIQPIKADLADLKQEIRPMKADIADLKQEIQPMKVSIGNLEREVAGIKIHLENVTDRNIRLLAENYVPAARRYEKEVSQIESMKTDIEILKQVVTEHSEKLQKLAY